MMKKELYNLIHNLKRKLILLNEIRKLRKVYAQRYEVEQLMEEWISRRILDGETHRRNELVQKQKEIQELELFINFLNSK